MRHRHDRQSRRRQPREIAKDVAATHEILDAVAQQIGAGALDQLHVRQLVLQCQLLHPQGLVEAVRLQRAGIDAGVVGRHHAAHAGDEADAGHDATARHALRRVRHIEHVASQGRQLQERRAGIEHQRDALTRQQLAALMETIFRRSGGIARPRLEITHAPDQAEHAVTIGLEGGAGGRDGVVDDGHKQQARY